MKQNIKAILAPMSPKERIAYIWDYYKFHIIGTIVAIILLISFMSSIGGKKEVVLNMTIIGQGVNTEGVVQLQEQLTNKLVQDADEEVSVQHLSYNKSSMDEASRAGIQKLSAEISLGSIDLMIVEKDLFEEISEQKSSLLPLNDIKGIDKIDNLIKSDEKVYGISTSDIKLLAPLELDANKVLCVPSTSKNRENINQFFTLIAE
jgi:hypothetical protein